MLSFYSSKLRSWLVSFVAWSLLAWLFGMAARSSAVETAADHPPPLSPAEEWKRLTVPARLEIRLVAAEPDVTQPLSICFDDRGRMWVLQYRQYPNPNGLKPVAMDEYLRTRYDQLPQPPPRGPKGQDRISICEDTDGDGRIDSVKDFLSDLNLASGMLLGYGGVFVVQPPYLLFYADHDHDDLPDGPPKVLLSGFGMDDAHAFANSLTWGPDGWLYGAQGSTVTADVRGIGFQQGIWRYHYRTDRFELFSEGGGNTWGVEFDAWGNLFAAGNTVEPLEHHVQGAYYVKGFGKHGPLHNPHTYGYFLPVQHHGFLGDSLSGGAIVYQGGVFPREFDGACICPHTRHSACRWATMETRGSTFATRHAGEFVTSEDIWFRPVDMTVGPDGAVYIADWYDYNISHSSPKNRSEWYQPSRLDGRVWRVAPVQVPPLKTGSIDLSQRTSAELIELLAHSNDWYARAARRILAERCDQTVVPELTKLAVSSRDQRLALQGLWSLHVLGALGEDLAQQMLASPHEYVRAWTVRLLGDARIVSPAVHREFVRLARSESSPIVRSQLACTAKRLPGWEAIPMIERLLEHDDTADPHIPLLLWWAIEDKAISETPLVMRLVQTPAAWRLPLLQQLILERLARRFLSEGTTGSYAAAAQLLHYAPTNRDVDLILNGMLQALSGRRLERVPGPLQSAIVGLVRDRPGQPNVVELALRLNVPGAVENAQQVVASRETPLAARVALIKSLGETQATAAVDGMLSLLSPDNAEPISLAAMAALGYFPDDRIASGVVDRYGQLADGVRTRAVELLCSRPTWGARLLDAVDAKVIPLTAVSLDQVKRLRQFGSEPLVQRIERHWGRVRATTPLEMQGRINAVAQLLGKGRGDAMRGRALFEKTCATCHKLHGRGNAVGPDLTGAERKNRELLVKNLVDPNSVIRPEFVAHVAVTRDGRVLTGLLAESNPETITLLDAKNQRTVLNRDDLDELLESPVSLMPEKLLDELPDQQIRDLFAYLQTVSES